MKRIDLEKACLQIFEFKGDTAEEKIKILSDCPASVLADQIYDDSLQPGMEEFYDRDFLAEIKKIRDLEMEPENPNEHLLIDEYFDIVKGNEKATEIIKLDGRLGFSLEISPEELMTLTGNDRVAAKELLIKLVQSEHCHIVGDTYFPVEWNEDVLNYEMEDNLSFNLPTISLNAGGVDKYKIAKDVELENFRNALECLGYCPDDYSAAVLTEMLNDLNDKLANNDVYNVVFNETLEEVVKLHEKVNSIEGLIANAKNTSEEANKNTSSKVGVELGKE